MSPCREKTLRHCRSVFYSVHLRYERMLHICHRDERDFISCELLHRIRLQS